MAMQTGPWTVDMVRELPDDGNRYECVDGVLLVTPAPDVRHQVLIMELAFRIRSYLAPLGRASAVLCAPVGVTFATNTEVQPDVLVGDSEEIAMLPQTLTRLRLAIEVLSASSMHADRVTKRRLYQEQGVPVYWIVDPDARLVEIWHPDDERPAIATEVLTWRLDDGAPELRIPLTELFTPPSA